MSRKIIKLDKISARNIEQLNNANLALCDVMQLEHNKNIKNSQFCGMKKLRYTLQNDKQINVYFR